MSLKSKLRYLQPLLITLGILTVTLAIHNLTTLPEPKGDGLPTGFAMIFLFTLIWTGIITLNIGLLIPKPAKLGIKFNKRQKQLFLTSALTALGSAIFPFILFTLLLSNPSAFTYTMLGLMTTSSLTLTGGILWKIGETIHPNSNNRPPINK